MAYFNIGVGEQRVRRLIDQLFSDEHRLGSKVEINVNYDISGRHIQDTEYKGKC